MFIYALKVDGCYFKAYLEDAEYIYLKNIFPEIAGPKAIRANKKDDKEVVKIKTKINEKGEVEYVHPEL